MYSSNLNNNVSKNKNRWILGSLFIQDPSGLRVEALLEPLSAGLVYPVSSSRPQQGENKHQAVAVHDVCGDALVDGARRGLSGQVALVPVELQLVGQVLSLPANPDELHDGEDTPVAVDVRGQEHNVLPLVEWRCPVFQDLANKGLYSPDIPLPTDAGTEAVQFIVQRLHTG